MGDSGHKFVKGLEAASITIDFLNDTATGEVLQTLQAAYGTNVTVTAKQTNAVVSATNPLYTMTCLVNNLTDINGAVGDLGTQSVTWNVSGTVVVTTA
jgi:predicted oxidoreductase (fatty acid repression mutant protein)